MTTTHEGSNHVPLLTGHGAADVPAPLEGVEWEGAEAHPLVPRTHDRHRHVHRDATLTTTSGVGVRASTVDAAKLVVRWGLGHQISRTTVRLAARRGDLQARLIKESVASEPWDLLEQVRLSGPVHKGTLGYLTTSLPVVKDVLSSADFATGLPTNRLPDPLARLLAWADDNDVFGPTKPPSLLVTNGADQVRYRKLGTRVFSVRAVEALRARTEQIADELLDNLAAQQSVDLVQAYGTLLPVAVICEVLGIPKDQQQQVLEFGAGTAPSLDLGLSWKRFRHVESSLAGFDAWLGQASVAPSGPSG